MTLDSAPFQVAAFEVTVVIYPHKPEVRTWLVANIGVEIGERRVAELDATIVKVLRHPPVRVRAETLLSLVRVIGPGPAGDAALAMLDGRGSGGAVVATARLDQAVA